VSLILLKAVKCAAVTQGKSGTGEVVLKSPIMQYSFNYNCKLYLLPLTRWCCVGHIIIVRHQNIQSDIIVEQLCHVVYVTSPFSLRDIVGCVDELMPTKCPLFLVIRSNK